MNYSQVIYETTRKFDGTKYDNVLREMINAYTVDDFKGIDEALKKLPTEIELYDSILEKVKGKSVEKNLKLAVRNTTASVVEHLIAVSSLLTHVAIECKNNKEYRVLLPDLHNKLEALIRQV